MTRIRIAVTAAVLVLAVALPAQAERLRICFEEWTPFASVVDGKPVGLVVDIVDRAITAAGHQAVYSQQPYPRCRSNVRSGMYDAILMSSDEAGLVPAGVSIAFWEVGVIARADWPVDRFGSLEDFNGATVGLVQAYAYHDGIPAAAPGWNLEYATEALFNLRKVAFGRIDLTMVDIPWTRIQIRREGLKLKVLAPTLFATPQRLYVHPGKADFLPGIDAEILRLIDDGTVDELYRQVVGTSFRDAQARAEAAMIRD